MKVYERIKEYDEEMLAEFLFRFATDTINHFGNFIMPDKENIRNFLNKEIPNTD